jgi:predicted transposase/invertase (TIGR01784 family)
LNILGYTHFEDDDESLRIFELYDPKRNKRPIKELLRIGYFELTKANIETENQKHWHDFFTEKEISPNAPDYIKKANEVIDFGNLGEEERAMANSVEKAQDTLAAELSYSYNEGKTEGKAEGLLEGLLNAAKFMLQKGDKPEDVASGLNLPLEQVYRLQS